MPSRFPACLAVVLLLSCARSGGGSVIAGELVIVNGDTYADRAKAAWGAASRAEFAGAQTVHDGDKAVILDPGAVRVATNDSACTSTARIALASVDASSVSPPWPKNASRSRVTTGRRKSPPPKEGSKSRILWSGRPLV